MTFRDRMTGAHRKMDAFQAEIDVMRASWKRSLLRDVARYERAVIAEFGGVLGSADTIGGAFIRNGKNEAAVRGMLQAIERLGYGELSEPLKEWAKKYAPKAYAQGMQETGLWHSEMSGSVVQFNFRDTDATFLRAALTDAYRFANRMPAESTRYFRTIWTRAMGERWTPKQVISALQTDGKLTSLVDRAGRTISVERRAEMFNDWHLTSTHNRAQRAKDTEAFGKDPLEIWDAVIDLHTAPLTLERAGKVLKRSEWQSAGGNVFDGSGIPPLWPGCRCRLRAVSKSWFSDDEWSRIEAGQAILEGEDLAEFKRLQKAA